MINLMWAWANNPLALLAGFLYQLHCCKKKGDWKKRFLPVILYLAAMCGCLAEGFFLTMAENGPQVAVMVCAFLAIHVVVAESAWLLYGVIWLIQKWIQNRRKKKNEMHKTEENNL